MPSPAEQSFREFCAQHRAQQRQERLALELQEIGGLFAQGEPLPAAPKPHDSGTALSLRGALKVWPHVRGQKRRVLDTLAGHPDGLTRNEIADLTGLSKDSVNGRVHELLELGAVKEMGERNDRAVVVLADAGGIDAA